MHKSDPVMDEALNLIERSNPAHAEVLRKMLNEKAERRKLRNVIRSPLAIVFLVIVASASICLALIQTGYGNDTTMTIATVPAVAAGFWYVFKAAW